MMKHCRITNARQWWLPVLGVKPGDVKENHRICSRHFPDNCFKLGMSSRILMDDVTPVCFKLRPSL